MSKKKDIIEAIHEEDLKELLINFDLYDKFQESRVKCKYCSSLININNISAIIIDEGHLEFICNNENCYEKLNYSEKGAIDD